MAACRMSEIFHQHIPVLLKETIDNLVTSPDGIYVDATFGRGSHAAFILKKLNQNGRLIAFDKDQEAVQYAQSLFQNEPRFSIFHRSFNQLEATLAASNLVGKIQGVLFDLGVSSPQLDDPSRGFSFMHDGALDMRMDTSQGISAADWLAKISETELADVLWRYGEEKFSRRIARAIVSARENATIQTTKQLSDLIASVVPRGKKPQEKHPATRSFQAIRIAINDELSSLAQGLAQAYNVLQKNGRIAAISFHSLEDRIVKQFFARHEKGEPVLRKLPIKGAHFTQTLRTVVKPIKPNLQEINVNPRARSATLRIAEKLL